MSEMREMCSRISLLASLGTKLANCVQVFLCMFYVSEIRQHNLPICSMQVKYANTIRPFAYMFHAGKIRHHNSPTCLYVLCE